MATKYYTLGGQRVAMRVGGNVTWIHGDHLGSASLTTNINRITTGEMRYYPYGEARGTSTVPTDRRFTGQREETGLGLYDYVARRYEPALGRFIQADTVVPEPGNPQSLNRYSYVLNNPLRYTDPTGHISNDPDELARAAEILKRLLKEYGVTIEEDWGYWSWKGAGPFWNSGSWELAELELVLQGVSDLAGLMGGAGQFCANLGGVEVRRKDMANNPGMANAHRVWLRSISSGGFSSSIWMGTWTVAHEFTHAWDAANGWDFSRDLVGYTGGTTFGGYVPGGTPPKGANNSFTPKEDFAESVTTFIYPQVAQDFIAENYPQEPRFAYDNYYNLPRAMFVAQKVNMDPQELLFLQGNRW